VTRQLKLPTTFYCFYPLSIFLILARFTCATSCFLFLLFQIPQKTFGNQISRAIFARQKNFFNHSNKKEVFQMLIIDVKDSENIDKALKKYKRKYERSGTLKQLRRRKAFVKPSITRRAEVLKAVYKEEKYGNHND
jgi:small subunit ribosomal protein S21